MIAVRALLLVALLVAPAAAQQRPLPEKSMAYTYCVDGRARSVMDMSVIGTADFEEVVAHEAKHREQYARFAPFCPLLTPLLYLDLEIEAYCASRPAAMRNRRLAKVLVDLDYITRIASELVNEIPADSVARLYLVRCP